MKSLRKTLILASAAMMLALGGAASASTFAQTHPARAEINHRLASQNARIHEERMGGEMSAAKAGRVHAADRRIRMQERHMAARHDGHLTPREARQLNHEENRVSRHIGR